MIKTIDIKNFEKEVDYAKHLVHKVKLDHYGVILMECKIVNTTLEIQKEPHSNFISILFIEDMISKKLFEIHHSSHIDIDTDTHNITIYT